MEPLTQDRDVTVHVDLADATIWLPTNVPVDLTCSTDLSSSNCTPGEYNTEAKGKTLYLTVETSLGSSDIRVES